MKYEPHVGRYKSLEGNAAGFVIRRTTQISRKQEEHSNQFPD